MKLSVLMALYQAELPECLAMALDSILNQTRPADEIVLVLDGPIPPPLEEVLKRFDSVPALQILRLPEHQGLSHALQTGLESCSHEFVARMDTDDIAEPNRFSLQLQELENQPGLAIIGSAIAEFDSDPGKVCSIRKTPAAHSDLMRFAKFRNPFNHQTVVFRKSIAQEVGGYFPMPGFEDYCLWIRIFMRGGQGKNIETPLVKVRRGLGLMGRRSGIKYIRNEIRFFLASRKIGFISTAEFVVALILRIPPRLLPQKALMAIYSKFLRSSAKGQ